MLPEPELRRALADIKPIPLHGPFNRFVSFDAMVSRADPGESLHINRPVVEDVPRPEIGHDAEGKKMNSPKVVRSPRPLWGIGSIRHGGRYNRPNGFEVIYVAEDAITALAEVDLIFRSSSANLSRIKGPPLVHITVDAILESVLDVTLPKLQGELATSHQELTGAWLWEQSEAGEAPTQRLGRVAFESQRLCGLRYPSSKNPGGICVAVFPDRLAGDSYLQVFDPYGNLAQRLPAAPATT